MASSGVLWLASSVGAESRFKANCVRKLSVLNAFAMSSSAANKMPRTEKANSASEESAADSSAGHKCVECGKTCEQSEILILEEEKDAARDWQGMRFQKCYECVQGRGPWSEGRTVTPMFIDKDGQEDHAHFRTRVKAMWSRLRYS